MNSLTRFGAGLGMVLAAAGGLTFTSAPVGEFAALQNALAIEGLREGTYQEEMDATFRRHRARERILTELSEERISVPEAAAQFEAVNREMPLHVQEVVTRSYAGYPENERAVRFLVDYAHHYLRRESPLLKRLCDRLEGESCELLHGGNDDTPRKEQ